MVTLLRFDVGKCTLSEFLDVKEYGEKDRFIVLFPKEMLISQYDFTQLESLQMKHLSILFDNSPIDTGKFLQSDFKSTVDTKKMKRVCKYSYIKMTDDKKRKFGLKKFYRGDIPSFITTLNLHTSIIYTCSL